MVIKKFMTITLNHYIIVNKIYLYNYTDKITRMIMCLENKNNYIKNIKIVFYMIKKQQI